MSSPLEPDQAQRRELAETVFAYLDDWYRRAGSMPASGRELTEDLAAGLMRPPGEEGRSLESILADLDAAGESGIFHPSGGHLSYIPNGGLYTAALAELLAAGLNRYTGISAAAPGMSAIEQGVVNWLASVFRLGEEASGLLLSGGSTANFSAVVAARTAKLGDDLGKGVIYLTRHTHHSVAKAARLAGFSDHQMRAVGIDDQLRMDLDSLAAAVEEDRSRGLRPFLVVGSAGTTDTGTVDPLDRIADYVSEQDLWFHVDAAYGGFFILTERGWDRLRGLERADSITVDPHKGLSMPFGVGALLVRDERYLIDANKGRGAYLREEDSYLGIRDIAALGPELSRPFRGLQVWLPLHLHGVGPFRRALDVALELAGEGYRRLVGIQGLETPWEPDLSIVAFRFEDDDLGRAALEAVNRDRYVHLSPTVIDDRFVLRFAILNRRTTRDHLDHAIDIIEKTLIG